MTITCRIAGTGNRGLITVEHQAEMHGKVVLCMSSGAQEFWVVGPKRETVSVTRQGGAPTVYQMGDRIPLPMFRSHLDLSEIFRA